MKHPWYIAKVRKSTGDLGAGSRFIYGNGGSLDHVKSEINRLGEDHTFVPSEYVEQDLILQFGNYDAKKASLAIDQKPLF